jgi:hypothetical protein
VQARKAGKDFNENWANRRTDNIATQPHLGLGRASRHPVREIPKPHGIPRCEKMDQSLVDGTGTVPSIGTADIPTYLCWNQEKHQHCGKDILLQNTESGATQKRYIAAVIVVSRSHSHTTSVSLFQTKGVVDTNPASVVSRRQHACLGKTTRGTCV